MIKAKILVVDDEELIRTVASKMLEFLGCQVLVAKNGAEAIALYQNHFETNETFDLVILDLKISEELNGYQLLEKLQQINPLVKGLLSSGISDSELALNPGNSGFVGVVNKPYDLKTLRAAVELAISR